MLSGYTIQEPIAQRVKTVIERAVRNTDGQAVIVKRLKADNPELKDINSLQREYEISKDLDCSGIVKPYSLESDGNSLALILEDFGGQSLACFLATHQLSLTEFFGIAIGLADTLSQLHSIPLIHKDIKPSNIIINPETQTVKLTDFNLATNLPFEYPASQNPNIMAGTLAYLSPEQTGRMNRYQDHRTDLYSLGVTFYQMLTGQLPFTDRDPLALIHAHIAELPVPPHEYRSIPLALSQIVLKLLAKNAEDRYRSATGLRFDLESCQSQWQQTATIEPFPLGKHDSPSKLLIPQTLYGQEKPIQTLLNVFDSICQGNRELVLVSGYAGIGKTSLVKELYHPLVKARGYFVSGKFDPLKRDTPYSAISEAFRSLICQLLTTNESELRDWRNQLQTALGNNAQMIIDLVPELELLLGKQPAVTPLTGTAAQNRFHHLFQRFVGVFCQPQHPLVLFLDDLQWADLASLQLIQYLVSETTIQYCLLIGAYRDNEVTVTHPLVYSLDKIKAQPALMVDEIEVQPLSADSVHQLVTDTLEAKADPEAITQLSRLIYHRTQGNPFFITQLLKTLDEEKLLTYDVERDRWHWDLEQIRGIGITDGNLIELLVRNLQKLPSSTQQVLKLAACIGNRCSLNLLATINQQPIAITRNQLWPALQMGFILSESEADDQTINYRFLHDRVQQAAYALLPEAEKQATHLRIGQLLQAKMTPAEQEEYIFTLVNQLNLGKALLTSRTAKDKLAKLNLKAGQKAKAATAYKLAANYLQVSYNLLATNCWENDYHFTAQLYLETAETEYLNTNFEQAIELSQTGIENSRTNFEKAQFLEIEIKVNLAKSQVDLAVEVGETAVAYLGVRLVETPPQRLDIAELANLPEMTEPDSLLAMEILNLIFAPACFAENPMVLSILYTMLDLSQRYGNSVASPYAYAVYGNLVSWQLLDIELAYQLGQLALTIVEKLNAKAVSPQVNVAVYINLIYKKQHIKETLEPLQLSINQALEVGNIEFACHNANFYCEHLLFVGKPLGKVYESLKKYLNFIANSKQYHQLTLTQITTQAVANLISDSYQPKQLTGEIISESATIDYLKSINNRILIFNLYHYKSFLSYLFQDFQNSISYSEIALEHSGFVKSEVIFTEHNFVYSLAILGQYRYATAEQAQTQPLKQVADNQELMEIWAYHAPMNFQYRYDLVEAEQARVFGTPLTAMELYDKAIAGAKENEYIQYVALGNELAGEFYLELGRQKIAQTYLAEAHYAYRRWGATAKLNDLESRYPQFRLPETIPQPKIKTETVIDSTTSSYSEELDLNTIVKAAQTLAAEIVLDNLLGKLIQIVVENAGAQLGYLILNKDGQLYLDAEAHGQESNVSQSIPLTNRKQLPLSLINYVARTKENLILDNATEEELFSHDPYIRQYQCQSILCTPILNQGELLGLIYLENNLTTEAFTPKRLETINILSSQAAISLKNAMLYQEMKGLNENLQQTKEALAESNRNLEQKVQERTQSLSETLEVLKATQAELRFENRLLRSEQDFSSYEYQVGGSLPLDAPTYVVRSADRYLYKAIKQGSFCYILNPRQMGKSSLMIQMMHHLRKEGFCCAAIDLTRIGGDDVTRDQWYKGLAVELWKNLGLLRTVNLKRWWSEQIDLSPVQRFSQFLEEVILPYVGVEDENAPRNIVIFIDEIDAVLSLNFSVNDFFGLIRACYNQRSINPEYKRLTFVLLGVAAPSDLITDRQRTPFNLGEAIPLSGFKHHEAQPLLQGLTPNVNHPQTVLREVLAWTKGQPFLTQKICRLIRNASEPIPPQQEASWVKHLVETRIIQNWEAQDEPEHLKTVRDRVLYSNWPRNQLLNLYEQILAQGAVAAQDRPQEKELLLSGLVEKEAGYLSVKNPIYEAIFNRDWVHRNKLSVNDR